MLKIRCIDIRHVSFYVFPVCPKNRFDVCVRVCVRARACVCVCVCVRVRVCINWQDCNAKIWLLKFILLLFAGSVS